MGRKLKDAVHGSANGFLESGFTLYGNQRHFLIIADHASNAIPPGIDLGIDAGLLDNHIAIDIGTAALSEARAVSVDVIEASALAYLEVVNRVASRQIRDRIKPTDHVAESVPA